MLTRCAFFEGHVLEGKEAAFEEFIEQRLMPLWRQFPGATDVRVLRRVAADPQAPTVHMMLEFDYPTQDALDTTVASPERAKAKAETEKLLSMFDGRLYHIVFER
jgi:antibiotic biosynthesis monooxygenase (ABM) superfamily enzyme